MAHTIFYVLILSNLQFTCPQAIEDDPEMTINHDAENTDPLTGFQNPFRHQRLDADAVVIQRRNFAVTTYHLADDPNGHPIFTRPLKDRGKKFIFFNNPSFPQGSGHYIVLRKMEGQNKRQGFAPVPQSKQKGNPVNKMPQFLYETFTLSFKDSLSGSVTDLDPFQYKRVRFRTAKRRRRPNLRRKLLRQMKRRKKGRKGPFKVGPFRRRSRGKLETPQDKESCVVGERRCFNSVLFD